MDLNNLLPDAGTRGCGYSANQFYEHYTNTLTDVSDSYFLGYVDPTVVPSIAFPTKPSYDSGTDEILFDSISKNNVPVGYCKGNSSEWGSNAFKFSDGSNTFSYQLSYIRYLNNFYPEFFSFGEKLRIYYYYFLYRPDGTLYTFSNSFFQIDGFTNINRFFENYTSASIPMYLDPTKYFSFKFADLVDGNGTVYIEEDTDSETKWTLRIFAARVGFAGGTYYNGSNYTASGYGLNIKTFGTFSDGTNGYFYSLGDCIGMPDLTNRIASFYLPTNTLFINTTYGRGAGCFNSVTFTGSTLPTTADGFIYDDGILAHNIGGSSVEFLSYISNPLSIKSMWGLCFRINPGGVASYVTGLSYATDVNDSQFESILKTGDIFDDAFKSDLEHWQYVDVETYDPVTNPQGVAENEFTTEDIPPYEPTPPEPGEEGDNPDNPDAALGQVDDTPADEIEEDRMNDARTVFGANTFITQYVLTLSQLTALGQYLWSGITDPNSETLKNFVAIFSDTGTFNSANCMQCFVSLKVFPFDMFNTVYSTTAPDLRAGSGHTALLSESVTIFSSCTYSIDCGTVDVTADGYTMVSGQYDFRNYVNATVCVFLPFCGTVELNPADVFGFTLSCMYYIDVSSGTCTACVFVDRGDNKRLMVASKSGQIGFNVPMSATNAMQVAGTFMSDAASAAQTITDTVLSLATARTMGSIGTSGASGANTAAAQQSNTMATSSAVGKTTSGISGAISGLGNMMSRNGCAYPSLSGGTGMAALFFDKTPYVVIRRSNYSSPNNYAHTTGFATTDGGTEHKSTLGAYSGWTVVKNCDLKNIHANREELDEIKHLLETGVYL